MALSLAPAAIPADNVTDLPAVGCNFDALVRAPALAHQNEALADTDALLKAVKLFWRGKLVAANLVQAIPKAAVRLVAESRLSSELRQGGWVSREWPVRIEPGIDDSGARHGGERADQGFGGPTGKTESPDVGAVGLRLVHTSIVQLSMPARKLGKAVSPSLRPAQTHAARVRAHRPA